METCEASTESYYSLKDEDFNAIVNEEQEDSHTLIQREFEHGKGSYFHCTKCDKSYLNIEDYIESHPTNSAKVEDGNEDDQAFDDLIEYDAAEDMNDSMHENTSEDIEEPTIKAEPQDIIETSSEKYFCYDCRTCFKELSDAEHHDCNQVEHAVDDSCNNADFEALHEYMCAFCEISFQDLPSLENHQQTCCNYAKQNESSLFTIQYTCDVCFKSFDSLKALGGHSRMHKKTEHHAIEQETTCKFCNIAFDTHKRLKLHMRIHEEKPIRSIQQVLPEQAQKEYNRLDHFYCEICKKSFDQKLLEVHKSMHKRVKKTCNLCNRHFDDDQSYEVHQQIHKTKYNESAANNIRTGPTDAMLRNVKNGIKSVNVENAKQTFPCQYCGHVFWRPFEKTRHERVHTGEKPYKCEICSKTFRVPYSLTLHLRTHTDIRPFVCSTCNKRFKSQSVYAHHLLTHQNERAYGCDVCDKAFRTSVQLNAHKKTHTRPFSCIVCNRPFASLHAVKLHMKSHEKSNVSSARQSCDICGAVYARTTFLRAHLKEHHGIELRADLAENKIYEESEAAEENIDESEAALLIIAAADAESREAQSQRFRAENDLAVDTEYLTNELIMDSFEETVETGF